MKYTSIFLLAFLASCSHIKALAKPYRPIEDNLHATVYVEMTWDAYRGESSGHSGSGTIVATDHKRDSSLVLTAAHVSHDENGVVNYADGEGVPVKNISLSITTFDGSVCTAHELVADVENDVAIVQADCAIDAPAEIAAEEPPLGAQVWAIGCPLAFHGIGMFPVLDGRFIGNTREEFDVEFLAFTFGSAPGLSGGGIYYNYKVFSLLQRGSGEFHHISLGATLDSIHKVYNKALPLWR